MSQPLTHLTFDVETLGLRENTVVLSLAVTAFEFENYQTYNSYVLDGFFVKFDAEDQIKNHHRTTTKSTLEWWKGQSAEARKMSLTPHKDDVSMAEGLEKLKAWIKTTKYDYKKSYIWSRGTYFDFPKIEHMYWQLDQEPPFNTWRIRDVRTYIDVLTGVTDGKYNPIKQEQHLKEFVAHHPLHDAAKDSYSMVEIFLNATDSLPPF